MASGGRGKKSVIMDARWHHDPKIIALPDDTAIVAFWVAIAEAKWQDPAGVFENEAVLRHALGIRAEALPALISAGLISRTPGGKYTFPKWSEWQTRTSTVRVRRWREGKKKRASIAVLGAASGD